MKIRSRVLAFSLSLVLAFCIVVPVRAAATALTAAEIFASLWTMYSSSVGLDTVYKTNGISNSISNPFDSSVASSIFQGFYNSYAQSINSNESIADWVSWAMQRISVGQTPGVGTVFRMSADLVQFFDEFGTYLLQDIVGLTKNAAGKFATNEPWFENALYSKSTVGFGQSIPVVTTSNYTQISSLSETFIISYDSSHRQIRGVACSTENSGVFVSASDNKLYMVTTESSQNWFLFDNQGRGDDVARWHSYGYISNSMEINGTNYVYYAIPSVNLGVWNPAVPTYPSLELGLSQFLTSTNNPVTEDVLVRPIPGFGEDVLGIPDVDDEEYAPDAITGVLSKPWDPALDASDALNPTLDWLLDNATANVDSDKPADTTADPSIPYISNNPDNYVAPAGIKDVFPFCLPFDLYEFFSCLAAEPVAPSFEIPIEFPPLDLTYTFEIDLSQFDTVAAILRKMELLAFIVGLILITRQKMIRG